MEQKESNKIHCYNCNAELPESLLEKVHRNDECEKCYANMRCCRMCTFYDTSSYNECREPSAERIVEKEKANYCDYFKLRGSGSGGGSKDNLMDAADALFKD